MTHGSLFSGVGGFDLSAEWMGWENKFHCEWDKFCQRVLKYYWPDAVQYGNIDESDFTVWRGKIDVLSGGFPCQPYSAAGKRKGKEDDRHKWPQMLRVIREIQPGWVVGENVYGLVNWSGGLVFDEVQSDLENEGYEVTPYILPACAVNAPHRRDRIWFVAYSSSKHGPISIQQRRQEKTENFNASGVCKSIAIADSSSQGLQESSCREQRKFSGKTESFEGGKPCRAFTKASGWECFPTQPPVRQRNDGVPSGLAGITVSKHRNESIKAYGNAIVPQVILQIFKSIEQFSQHKPD